MMDNSFRVGKTSVQIASIEIGRIYGLFGASFEKMYVLIYQGEPIVLSDDWNGAENFFLCRVPADCISHVKFVRNSFGE